MSATIIRDTFTEGSPFKLRAFWPKTEGARIMTSDVDTSAGNGYAIRIFDRNSSDATTPIYLRTGIETASNIIYDTLQTWGQDDVGYNTKVPISLVQPDTNSAVFAPEGGHLYKIEIQLRMVDTSEDPKYLVAFAQCLSIDSV